MPSAASTAPSETVYLTALVRDGQGNAVTGGPLTLVIERPDGVEYRRAVLPDQGAGGRTMSVALNSAVPTGTWRVRAFTDPKGSSVGETTFMVEDYIPERIEFDVSAKEKLIKAEAPVELKVDGRFLYGAPASGLQLEGDMLVATAASGRPGYPGYQFGVADEETASNERTPIENLPEADANGVATFPVSLAKPPTSTRPQEAQIFIRMAEAGGRAVERKLVLPVAPAANLIGVKPLFEDKSVAEGDKAEFDVVFVAPDGKQLPRSGLRYELMKIESRYQWYRQNSSWEYEPVKSTKRVADGDLTLAADKAARVSLSPQPGRYRLDVKSTEAGRPDHLGAVRRRLVLRRQRRHAGPAGDLDRQAGIPVRRHHGGVGQCAHRGQADRQRARRPPADDANHRRQGRHRAGQDSRRQGLGHRRLCAGDAAPSARCGGAADARPRDRAEMVRHRQEDAHAARSTLSPPPLVRPGTTLKIPVKLGGLNPGEDAKIVVAAVDVGILNLTNYKPPAPDDYYLGQRRLTSEIRDLYGQLIDGMQGTRGQIRSGGDAAGAELQGTPPTQKPLALYSGIVTVGADGYRRNQL